MEGGGYRINKSVRQRCAFVRHDLAADPPFSKLDLVCCRNVLIYFGQELQKRVLANFHFALNEPGVLLLGYAENIADGTNLFRLIDRENKIFARTAAKSVLQRTPARDAIPDMLPITELRMPASLTSFGRKPSSGPVCAPGCHRERAHGDPPLPGTNRALPRACARPTAARPFEHGPQRARRRSSHRHRAERDGRTTVRRSGVRVEQDGSTLACDVVVVPVALRPESPEDVFAVLFEQPVPPAAPPTKSHRGQPSEADGVDRKRFGQLEDELKATKEHSVRHRGTPAG